MELWTKQWTKNKGLIFIAKFQKGQWPCWKKIRLKRQNPNKGERGVTKPEVGKRVGGVTPQAFQLEK